MVRNERKNRTCAVCGKALDPHDGIAGVLIREPIAQLILRDHPDWSREGYLCRADLAKYRADYVHNIVESEKGEITFLEEEVLHSLQEHQILSTNVDSQFEQARTLGQKLADRIASFGGSWTFVALFGVFILLWIAMNSIVLYRRPVDPYPFILLNLFLSCLAAIQAPVIMMSQNRQEVKDRLRGQRDYQINLKAELEIRHLHEKIDHLLLHQWERLVEIQEVQLDLLSELERRK
jgi:uncharacterized membrane protein